MIKGAAQAGIERLRELARTLSLQRRVSYLATIAVALAVAATGVAGYLTLRYSLYAALDSQLVQIAGTLSPEVQSDIRRLGGLTGDTLQASNISAAVVGANGQVINVPEERVDLQITEADIAVARLQGTPNARTGRASDGSEYRIVAVALPNLGNYALVVGRPLAVVNQILSSLWLILIIFGTTGVIVAAAAGTAVARSSLRPVRQLSTAAERVAATDDLTPIQVTGSDDLTTLADAFNRMLRALALSRERQQRLIADAGHELRTPLTSLRTNIELLAADQKSNMLSDQDRSEIFADVSAQLAEFTTLINNLVQLSRDEKAAAAQLLDFRDVINASLERVRRRAPRTIRFDVELDPFYVIGESDDLERAVTNLLDNAVKWSPPDGTIRVQLEGDRLRVADQGPGIAAADLPYVFDRFYRSDLARTTPGTGLGLSIVAQTITRHGGWVRAGRSAQGGAEFTVHLPGAVSPDELAGVDASAAP